MTVEGRSICPGKDVPPAPGINDGLNVHPAKVTLVAMLEQRHVICFLLREGLAPTQTPERLRTAYGGML
jgi:hypothetical protein